MHRSTVGNVELGKMNEWVKFYEDDGHFKMIITFDDKGHLHVYSALMKQGRLNRNGYIKFPDQSEPAEGKKKSQIDEYANFTTAQASGISRCYPRYRQDRHRAATPRREFPDGAYHLLTGSRLALVDRRDI